MQRVDYVIAGLAVLALLGSVIGVIWYEADEMTLYDVTVSERDGSADVWSTTLSGPGASDDETWNLPQRNITDISFIVSISSSPTLRDGTTQVEVTITSPAGETESATLDLAGIGADDDEDTIEFHIHAVPQNLNRVGAENRSAAVAMIETGLNGTGAWSLNAEIIQGGSQGPLGLQDEDVTVNVRAEFQFYRASAQAHVPDIGRAG